MFRTNFTHNKELDNNLNMTTKNPGRITSIRSDDSDNLHDKLNCYLVHLALCSGSYRQEAQRQHH